jgi:arginyl-tRNA synthetase
MNPDFDWATGLDTLLRAAAARIPALAADFEPQVRLADPRHGDFQANGVLAAAKRAGTNPRALAAQLLEEVQRTPGFDSAAFDTAIAGPGFINFTLKPAALAAWLRAFSNASALERRAAEQLAGKKLVVDFSSPNTAKRMHIGHIRSTVIGEAVSRILSFFGADIHRDNHIGDWGTQFGIILMQARIDGLQADAIRQLTITDIEELYRRGNQACDQDPAHREAARRELVKLQTGEPQSRALWQAVTEVSYAACQRIYERLGIVYDSVLGESFYEDKVAQVYDKLVASGVAEESEGALVVFQPGHPRFSREAERPYPFIIRKKDGASNYASTDLATAWHRTQVQHAQGFIILTDARQNDHFEQLFLTVERWFQAEGLPVPEMRHITFGTILGSDGKAIKTRSGEPVLLEDVLDEAEGRAYQVVSEKNPELSEEDRREVARVVGLGALRYADLSQNRSSDYKFDWDRMLSFEGNTAPYLLYAVARIYSIFRKAGRSPAETFDKASEPETPEELALARKLCGFAGALQQTRGELRPHFLCNYLYELAGAYSTFYNANKVMVEETAIRERRLQLCARTLLILETGLGLLGLETLERM